MSTVAILANPASGKDIRRLIAHGSVFDNQEKVRMVRRLLLGLEAAGVQRVLYMPDGYGIVPRALQAIAPAMPVLPIEMPLRQTQQDTIVAAGIMETLGADVMVVLGGDGTSRAACKGSCNVPILPLSTGTNNVFPVMVEATVAGLAAGVVATGALPRSKACRRATMFEVLVDETPVDMALVDIAVYDDFFVASRAVWDMEKVPQLFLSRCTADSIGLSSIGGQLTHIAPHEPRGLALELGPADKCRTSVLAAIAPGRFARVGVRGTIEMQPEVQFTVSRSPCLLALDGEREVEVHRGSAARVRLRTDGPWVVDVPRVLTQARALGLFVTTSTD